MKAAPWNTHPLLLSGPVIPQDGLHLIVGGKAWWMSPAKVRDWIAADPWSPTLAEDIAVTRFNLNAVQAILALRKKEAAE